ncbi:MAG: hypothetical protein AAF514_06260, partial [Verrucomicrobiota bacterium]
MDPASVEYVFHVVSKELPGAGIAFLMIGGHAVNHYGYTRATADIDFMVAADDLPTIKTLLKKTGFTKVSESDNVVFFNRPGSPYRAGFLRVAAETLRKLLENAVQIDYSGVPLKVPGLLDLMEMKLFAVKGGSARREEKDFPDIVRLVVGRD